MPWITIGALLSALAVACGAFGAHALADRLDPRGLELWETGSRYLMYTGLAVVLTGVASQATGREGLTIAAGLLSAGGLVFFSTLAAMALGAPRWLGMITPIGGVLMIAGFLALAWFASR